MKGVQVPYLVYRIYLKRCQAERLNKKGCWIFFSSLQQEHKICMASRDCLTSKEFSHGLLTPELPLCLLLYKASLTGLVLLQTLTDPWKSSSSLPLRWSFWPSLRKPGLLVSFRSTTNVCGIVWEFMAFSSVQAFKSVASLLWFLHIPFVWK